jgi:hypothetical protein
MAPAAELSTSGKMEPAGLALAIVSVAGLFKNCIDLFDTFSAARNLGRDYEILEAKLDIEKTLLLHWADRVGLVNDKPDVRFADPIFRDEIYRVLFNIQLLLSESSDLQSRYGLRAKQRPRDSSDSPPAHSLSENLGTRLSTTIFYLL